MARIIGFIFTTVLTWLDSEWPSVAIPIALVTTVLSSLGVYSSHFVPKEALLWAFVAFVVSEITTKFDEVFKAPRRGLVS